MKKIYLILILLSPTIVTAQAWQACNFGLNSNNTSSEAICVHNNKVFATNSQKGLQVSTDNGVTWTLVNSNILLSSVGVDMYSTGNRLYIQQTNTGCMNLQYSTDDGVTFQMDTLALPKCYAGSINIPSSGYYGGTVAWKNHLMMSLAGPDWEWSRNTSDAGWVDASYFDANDCGEFTVKNDTCWAATNGATSNGVAWSTDGINWTSPLTTGLPPYYVPTQIAWLGNRLFMMGGDVGAGNAGADTILKYSDDYGLTFKDVNIKQYLDPYAFFTYTGKQPTLDMFTAYNKLYLILGQDALDTAPELIVSNDNGMTFQKDTVGFPTSNLSTVCVIRNMEYLNGWVFAQLSAGDIYRKQVGPTSINETMAVADVVKLFPNPATNRLSIDTKLKLKSVFINDLTGKQVARGFENEMDLSNFADGIYYVTIHLENNRSYTQKLVIQK